MQNDGRESCGDTAAVKVLAGKDLRAAHGMIDVGDA
jgi:hypothetical protein